MIVASLNIGSLKDRDFSIFAMRKLNLKRFDRFFHCLFGNLLPFQETAWVCCLTLKHRSPVSPLLPPRHQEIDNELLC